MSKKNRIRRRIIKSIKATQGVVKPVKQKPLVFNAALNNARPNSDTFRNFQNLGKQTTEQVLNTSDVSSIRSQARNEFLNNPHASGIARLFALYVIGVGPRLKFTGYEKYLLRKGLKPNKELCDYVEYLWTQYAKEIKFVSILKQATQTLVVDGEAFINISPNPKSNFGSRLQLIDGQRVGNPGGELNSRFRKDGVTFDEYGNVENYCVYNIPDNGSCYYNQGDYQFFPAENTIHLFRQEQPDQVRGLSWFSAVIPLLQQAREYTAAVIEAAKSGAKTFMAVETTDGFIANGWDNFYSIPGCQELNEGRLFETGNGSIRVMSPGLSLKPVQSSQPINGNDAFIDSILTQIGYSLGLPRNRATGSSASYNFASGKLDNQPFELLIKDLQELIKVDACDKIFEHFYKSIYTNLLERFDVEEIPSYDDCDWAWTFPNPPLVDAQQTAATNAIRLKSNQATMEEIWSETHVTDFDDVRDKFIKDRQDFPEVFGASLTEGIMDNTRIDYPSAPSVDHVDNEGNSDENNLY